MKSVVKASRFFVFESRSYLWYLFNRLLDCDDCTFLCNG